MKSIISEVMVTIVLLMADSVKLQAIEVSENLRERVAMPQLDLWSSRNPGKNMEIEQNSILGNISSATNVLPGLLIIYAPNCVWHHNTEDGLSWLDGFINWKKAMGYHVDTVCLGAIPSINLLAPNTNDVDDVKEYIQLWYATNHEITCDPKYVLLIGDAFSVPYNPVDPELIDPTVAQKADSSHMPTYAGYTRPAGLPPSNNETDDIYDDFYYQLLSGEDDEPDIAIGRWCTRNPVDFRYWVARQINFYEAYPSSNWDCDRLLFVASKAVINLITMKSVKENIRTSFVPSYIVTEAYGVDGATNNDICNALNTNRGVGVVNYLGHGSTNSWWNWNLSSQSFTTANISALANWDMCPVVFSTACYTGDFVSAHVISSEECMAEAWTRSRYEELGAVAAFGSGQMGPGLPDTLVDVKIFEALYATAPKNCGDAIKSAQTYLVENNGTLAPFGLYLARIYNYFGDPTLDVWRDEPVKATLAYTLDYVTGEMEFEVRRESDNVPVPGALVCIWNSQYHWINHTDIAGKAQFPFPTGIYGTFKVTATNQTGPICIKPVGISFNCSPSLHSNHPGTEESEAKVIEWNLGSINPNPFFSTTTISYSVGGTAGSADPQPMVLSIFDVSGRHVRQLVKEQKTPGSYQVTWNGRDEKGSICPKGIYLVRMYCKEFYAKECIVFLR